MMTDLFAASL